MNYFTKVRSGVLKGFFSNNLPIITTCVFLTLFIGYLDYVTGYELDFFLFYFLPIAICAWYVGRRCAFFIAMLSVVTWTLADRLSNLLPSPWLIESWNGAIKALAFSLVVLSVSIMKNTFERERRLNSSLSETLGKLEEEGRKRWLATQEVIKQSEFLQHVFESLNHPFYVVDSHDYTVVMANPAAAPNGLRRGVTCYSLTHHQPKPCSGSEHVCPLESVKETKKPFITEHVHYGEDGSLRNVEVHCHPILDGEGNVAQVIEYALDITDRKQLEEDLRASAEKIKIFAYCVSHDLKSPLVGLNGLTKLLYKRYAQALDEKGRTYCEQILKASEHALNLIEEINIYVRAKEAPLDLGKVDPKEIFRAIREEFDALLNAGKIRWSEPTYVPEVVADKTSLMRVFRNLVDNALKYGGERLSGITIGYGQSDECHTFSIADDGAGIKVEACEKIFEPFERCSAAPNIQGTGLGLSIVKEIAQKHGGRVWYQSSSQNGTTFYVSVSKDLQCSKDCKN